MKIAIQMNSKLGRSNYDKSLTELNLVKKIMKNKLLEEAEYPCL